MSVTALFAGLSLLVGALAAPGPQTQQNPNANLPIVDLGYEQHQAAFYNVRLSLSCRLRFGVQRLALYGWTQLSTNHEIAIRKLLQLFKRKFP
jgi:hypothetical protein